MAKKQFITTVAIDDDIAPNDDRMFITQRGLKPTNLLRSKIKELRAREEGAPTVDGMQKNISRLQSLLQEIFDFMDKEGVFENWQTYQKSLNN